MDHNRHILYAGYLIWKPCDWESLVCMNRKKVSYEVFSTNHSFRDLLHVLEYIHTYTHTIYVYMYICVCIVYMCIYIVCVYPLQIRGHWCAQIRNLRFEDYQVHGTYLADLELITLSHHTDVGIRQKRKVWRKYYDL